MASAHRKFAVVTGASSGIGYELAKQFAQHHFDLLIAAEDAGIYDKAEDLRKFGANVTVCQVDLAKNSNSMDMTSGVMMLWRQIEESGRKLDAIALNAGVGVGGPFTETSFEDEINMINLNVISTYHLAKHVVQKMKAQRHGKILITASIAGIMPTPFQTVYGATKAFDLSLAEALRSELKDSGVTVTALMPGATETNFFHRANLDNTKVGVSEKDDAADVAKDGFEALMNGDDKVIAHSLKTKLQGYMAYIQPDEISAAMHRKMAEPGSAKKAS